MKAKEAYLKTAQRYLESAKKHQSLGIDIQEVIGFLAYHALEWEHPNYAMSTNT